MALKLSPNAVPTDSYRGGNPMDYSQLTDEQLNHHQLSLFADQGVKEAREKLFKGMRPLDKVENEMKMTHVAMWICVSNFKNTTPDD